MEEATERSNKSRTTHGEDNLGQKLYISSPPPTPAAPIIEAFQQNQVKYDKTEAEMKNAFQRNKNRVEN